MNVEFSPEQEQHPHSHLFTLRVWQETLGEGKVEWRGRVQDVAGGETQYFRDWSGLIHTLERLIAQAIGGQECGSGPALPEPEKDWKTL